MQFLFCHHKATSYHAAMVWTHSLPLKISTSFSNSQSTKSPLSLAQQAVFSFCSTLVPTISATSSNSKVFRWVICRRLNAWVLYQILLIFPFPIEAKLRFLSPSLLLYVSHCPFAMNSSRLVMTSGLLPVPFPRDLIAKAIPYSGTVQNCKNITGLGRKHFGGTERRSFGGKSDAACNED